VRASVSLKVRSLVGPACRGDGAPGQRDRGDDAAQVAAHEGDVGGGDGHVGTGADGDADVRAGQCGRIVNAVADHGDHVPGGLQRADLLGLLVRQHLREDVADGDVGGDRLRGGGVVAGEHPHFEAERLQLGDRAGRIGLDGIGHHDQADRFGIDSGEHRGLAGGAVPARGTRSSRGSLCCRIGRAGIKVEPRCPALGPGRPGQR
jgi:hypothetical protein